MAKRTVADLKDLRGTRVFVRVDYNVPLKDGRITDDTRIRASLPTLRLLVERGARAVLASHLGRPKKGPSPELSLAPVAARLSELLGRPVAMATDCVGPDYVDAGPDAADVAAQEPAEEPRRPGYQQARGHQPRSCRYLALDRSKSAIACS